MRRLALALLVVASAACSGGGGEQGPMEWRTERDSLERVVLSAAGPRRDDLWVAGGGLGNGPEALLAHLDGETLTALDTGLSETLWWVWVAPSGEVFAVGEGGVILRVVDGAVERMDSGTTAVLYGVWGTSADDLWAVGGDPFAEDETDVVLRYQGDGWTRVSVPDPAGVALFKVHGSGPDDVWIVGQFGEVLRWDGAALERLDAGTGAFLFTVWASAPDDVWLVGGPPRALVHYDGTGFESLDPFDFGNILNGVAASPDGRVVVVGTGGTKWVRDEGVWTDESDIEPFADLHAVWVGSRGEAVAVGGNFNAPTTPGSPRIGVIASRAAGPILGD